MRRDDWNLEMVQSRAAQARLPQRAEGDVDWGPLRVCLVDTGFTRHPIFGDWSAGKAWLRPEGGINLREPGTEPVDPLDYEGQPGHGTRVGSVLCGDARGLPGAPATEIGVAPGLPVVPCRVVDSVLLLGEPSRMAVGAGILHAIDAGCQVVSISLGIPAFPPWLKGGMGKAVDRAYEAGLIVVAAGGQVIDRVTYPGKFNRTIGCGGVTWQRRIWHRYTDGAETIDVWAPAEGIWRADALSIAGTTPFAGIAGDDPGSFGSSSSSSAGGLGKGEGTSYATVHVAAAAAMWLRHHGPALDHAYGPGWRRVEAFRLALRRSAGRLFGNVTAPSGSGLLAIDDLLREPLPRTDELTQAPPDRDKFA